MNELDNIKRFTWIPLPKFERAIPVHTKNAHYYKTPRGDVFPSVTTMLRKVEKPSPGLLAWRDSKGESVANHIIHEAKENGTATHSIIEKYLNNKPLSELTLLVKGHFRQMLPLLNKIDQIYATEIPLYSYSMRLAGMADCIAKYDGISSVIDFKTSRTKKKEEWIENYFLQATAYCTMWNQLTGNKIKQIVILISSEDKTTLEDASVQKFVRNPKDYESILSEKLEQFQKMENDKQ